MYQLLPFFIILVAGLFFSEVFRKMHLPIVVALIFAGLVIGPFGFGFLESDLTLDFLGRIGLVFLMFIAGLEVKLSGFKAHVREISVMSIINGLIPFLAGIVVMRLFGYGFDSAVFVGIVFISSSVTIITSSFAGLGLLGTRIGVTSIGGAVVQDIASLVILGVMLQMVAPSTDIPLVLFYGILIAVVLFLYWIVPKIHFLITYLSGGEKNVFENELRLILVVLIGIVVVFELFGLHDIVAGFFAGLVLSESITHESLKEKFRSIGYGFFIPIFFILVGIKTDISVFANASGTIVLFISLFAGSVLSKTYSGYLAARATGFRKNESLVMGVATTSQLFTTLAVVYTGLELGIIPTEVASSLVVVSMVATVFAPLCIGFLGKSLALTKNEETETEIIRAENTDSLA